MLAIPLVNILDIAYMPILILSYDVISDET
jgi:hypothetical protein